jgi:hypothetical protein
VPHHAIAGQPHAFPIVNLTDKAAADARAQTVALAVSDPGQVVAGVQRVLTMPSHHDVRTENLDLRRLGAALQVAANQGPSNFPELLLTPNIGKRTLLALALVAEVVHGAPSRFTDPARFSFAHGGKDGHPFPVPLRIYDETLRVLRRAVDHAKLDCNDKLQALRRLDDQCRISEAVADGKPLPASAASLWSTWVEHERRASPSLAGRTCTGLTTRPRQLALPL